MELGRSTGKSNRAKWLPKKELLVELIGIEPTTS